MLWRGDDREGGEPALRSCPGLGTAGYVLARNGAASKLLLARSLDTPRPYPGGLPWLLMSYQAAGGFNCFVLVRSRNDLDDHLVVFGVSTGIDHKMHDEVLHWMSL